MRQFVVFLFLVSVVTVASVAHAYDAASDFLNPPDSARPWVYWMFMDGNISREGMTADLESMKRVGIGGVIFMEVNIGMPRGPVEFMSPKWQELFAYAVHEADRLGLQFAVATGPGWCGTGGPWVKPEQSMQHLVASETTVHGPDAICLPRCPARNRGRRSSASARSRRNWPRPGGSFTPTWPCWPSPRRRARPAWPISTRRPSITARRSLPCPGVKPFLPEPDAATKVPAEQCIARQGIVDLTARLTADGRLEWDVPAGDWTILRFGRTSTGQMHAAGTAAGPGVRERQVRPGGHRRPFRGLHRQADQGHRAAIPFRPTG